MFELTYDILDDLECISTKSAVEKILDDDERMSVFENMTPAEWYDAASERGCNCMFTYDFFFSRERSCDVYTVGELLNDLVWRFFGDTLKVQPIYFGGEISDEDALAYHVQKEERIDTFRFLGMRIQTQMHHVTYKIAVHIDFEHPSYRTVSRVLNFLANLYTFNSVMRGNIYFLHLNGYSQIECSLLLNFIKHRHNVLDASEIDLVKTDLNRIFCKPEGSHYSENIIDGALYQWMYRYNKNMTNLNAFMEHFVGKSLEDWVKNGVQSA